jgi:hypothetical protein
VAAEHLLDLIGRVIHVLVLAFIEVAPDFLQVSIDLLEIFIKRLALLFAEFVAPYDHRPAVVVSAVVLEAVGSVDAAVAALALGCGVGKWLELIIGKAEDKFLVLPGERSHKIYCFTNQAGQIGFGEQRPVADEQEVLLFETFLQRIQILEDLFLIGGVSWQGAMLRNS